MLVNSTSTGEVTTSDTAVTLLAAPGQTIRFLSIINEGTVAGFFSIDGGVTYGRLPAGATGSPASVNLDLRHRPVVNTAILIKRIASGSDLASVFAIGY